MIGTASAALITNYATLTGEATVTNPITVIGDGGPVGGILEITFEGNEGDFIIENSGVDPVMVKLEGSIYPVGTGPDTEGLSIVYSGNDVTPEGSVTVPGIDDINAGQSVVTVTLDAAPNVEEGSYTITINVNPVV